MPAEIEVRSVFHVRGRGAVVIAYLRQGVVRIGQRTRPLPPGGGTLRLLTLAAVETVRSPEGGADALGLVFRERPSLAELGSALPAGTLLRFEDAAGPDDARGDGVSSA